MKKELQTILTQLEKMNMEIKFPYETEEELMVIIKKIAQEKISFAEKYKLTYQISEKGIFILKNNKIMEVYDNFITDLSSNYNNLHKKNVLLKDGKEEKLYILGFVSKNYDGFVATDNMRKSKKIIEMYLEKFYEDFI